MKPSAFLINTSRGPVVDEGALNDALEKQIIAGAGLDVYEHEPKVHPGLIGRHNVVLAPHLGSATAETRTKMAVMAAMNASALFQGDVYKRQSFASVTPGSTLSVRSPGSYATTRFIRDVSTA